MKPFLAEKLKDALIKKYEAEHCENVCWEFVIFNLLKSECIFRLKKNNNNISSVS